MQYILGIDQSTQGTKAILVDEKGTIIGRADRSHKQIINEKGWVSHDLDEIYRNVISATRDVIAKTEIDKNAIRAIGISNQRETTAIWNKSGIPLNHAVVWQCSRAKDIAAELKEFSEEIRQRTGLQLSPYFPAAKMAWLLQNTPNADPENICLGTIDSWLIYRMTEGNSFKTDYSNASRTQLFNIENLKWDEKICNLFHIPPTALPKVCDSNSNFGTTDLEGLFEQPIPIQCALGDSHAALFGQGCHHSGMIKATYGTGSSIMMNTGDNCITSTHGLVTSLAWGIDGNIDSVLEGNINYTGAVITWLKDDVKLIASPGETEAAAKTANPEDNTILIPAFSGLGAPYWNDNAQAMLYGMTRTTGRNEIIKAALDSIAFQIQAVVDAMANDSKIVIGELRVDGGPTRNTYLMQTQSDLTGVTVATSSVEELSALGAAYLAGISIGMYEKESLFSEQQRTHYHPAISQDTQNKRLATWQKAVNMIIK